MLKDTIVYDLKYSNNKSNKVGRPNCFNNEKIMELLKAYYSHPYSYRQLADMFGVSRMTVWRTIKASVSFVSVTSGKIR